MAAAIFDLVTVLCSLYCAIRVLGLDMGWWEWDNENKEFVWPTKT